METISCILKLTKRNMVVASDAFKNMYCLYKMNSAAFVCPAFYFVRASIWQRPKQCSFGWLYSEAPTGWSDCGMLLTFWYIYIYSSLCFLELLRSGGNNIRVHMTAVKNWFLQHAGTQQAECDLAFRYVTKWRL